MHRNSRQVVSIRDVATEAKTSIATVSRVLNGSEYPVSAEKRKAVLAAANKLGYEANLIGRILKTKVNPVIGIIIPSFQNPFFTQLIIGIEQEAIIHGYYPVAVSSQRNPEIEQKFIQHFKNNRVCGLMISSIDPSSATLEQYVNNGGVACVFESYFELDNIISAKTDSLTAARTATQYLISNGHKNIAFLSTPINHSSRIQRLDGIKLEMANHGLPFGEENIIAFADEKDIVSGHYEFEVGKELAHRFINSSTKFTAIIAANDLLAIGIMKELQNHNIKVPEDVSIIGFDNIPECDFTTPRLTTIDLPSRQLGQNACRTTINAISSKTELLNFTISVKSELVERESVKNISDHQQI